MHVYVLIFIRHFFCCCFQASPFCLLSDTSNDYNYYFFCVCNQLWLPVSHSAELSPGKKIMDFHFHRGTFHSIWSTTVKRSFCEWKKKQPICGFFEWIWINNRLDEKKLSFKLKCQSQWGFHSSHFNFINQKSFTSKLRTCAFIFFCLPRIIESGNPREWERQRNKVTNR